MKFVFYSPVLACLLSLPITALAVVQVPGYGIVEPQNDNWSCAVNQLTRVLVSLGYTEANYTELKEIMPRSLRLDAPGFGKGEFGPTPNQIQDTSTAIIDYLKTKPNEVRNPITRFKSVTNNQLQKIIDYINSGTPTLALLKGEEETYFGIKFPNFHYVIPVDYETPNDTLTQIVYMDSSGELKRADAIQFHAWWRKWNQLDLTGFKTQLLQALGLSLQHTVQMTDDTVLEGGTLIVPEFASDAAIASPEDDSAF